jgi:hypothetical protein
VGGRMFGMFNGIAIIVVIESEQRLNTSSTPTTS